MESKHQSRATIIAALIGGACLIIATLIGGCFTVYSTLKSAGPENNAIPTSTFFIGNTTNTNITKTPSSALPPNPTDEISYQIQPNGYEFFDDFELGLSDKWEIQYGQLGMVNGKLTVTAPSTGTQTYHFITLRELYWGDVTVEVELASFNDMLNGTATDGVGAVVLHQGISSQAVGVVFYPRYEGMEFGTFSRDGEWLFLPTSFISGVDGNFDLYNSAHTIKIVSRGDIYTVYIDNRKITSASVAGSEAGTIGLWFKTSKFGDTEFYAPRIESVRITSNQP